MAENHKTYQTRHSGACLMLCRETCIGVARLSSVAGFVLEKMNLKQQKIEFIKNEIFASTIAGAFSRGFPIYRKVISDKDRSDLYGFIKDILVRYEKTYENKIGDEQHIKNIQYLQRAVNEKFASILKLHFGRTQKLLNLYLKYLWSLGFKINPQHCPFDAIIISKLRADVPPWTCPDFEENHYKVLTELAKQQALKNRLSIAEWELWFWNQKNDTKIK